MDNNTNTLHSPRTQGGMTDMTVGSPARGILRFAVPLVLGYILQQMYQVIDAVIVGRWIGVGALAAVGASSSIMFLIMGFCNGSCAGFAIPVAQAFGAKDFAKMRSYVSNAVRIKYLFTCVFENIGVAMATYCGQNIGAGAVVRIRQGIAAAIRIMGVYFIFTLLLIIPFADEMMALFVSSGEAEVIRNAARFMRIANYFYPALGLLTILRYSIQGLGYSNLAMMSGVMEMFARAGVSLWLVPALAFLGVCFGDPVAWVAADLFLVPAFLFVYRRIKRGV